MNKRGYLDPGTGGYLVTSIWPTIATFFAVIFAAVGTFFVKFFINPIKRFVKDKKKMIIFLLVILLIANLTVLSFIFLKPTISPLPLEDNLSVQYNSYNNDYNFVATPAGDFTAEKKVNETNTKKGKKTTEKKTKGPSISQVLAQKPNAIIKAIQKNNAKNIANECGSKQPEKSGIYVYDKNQTYPGYILVENKLLAENGSIVHQWGGDTHMGVIQPDGTYVAQRGNSQNRTSSLVKYSFNGTLIWEKQDVKPHHKISLTDENTILTIGKETHKYRGELVDFDVIVEYDQNGNQIWNWSTWENFDYLQTFHKPLAITNDSIKPGIKSIWGGYYDYYHMNSVEEIKENVNEWYEVEQDGKIIQPFKRGNIVFNFRHGSMIFILDKETGKIVWHVTQYDVLGEIQGQHDSNILPNGNLLIYDNGRYRKSTRIIELNPITKKIEWQYSAPNFFTIVMGDANKLANGNYLLSETVNGRAFEINSNGKILWEYFNPSKTKNNGILKRADIFQIKKYDFDFINNLLKNNL